MNTDLSQFVQVLKRIPLFQGLKTDQARIILQVSERQTLQPGEPLCTFGEPSNHMYVLLSGELSVRTQDDVQVAIITPIAPVGEMGIFTGETRSATVLARATTSLLVLSKAKLDMCMRRNPAIEIAISRNLIDTLSQRLRTANQEIAHLQHLIADQGAPPETLLEDDTQT